MLAYATTLLELHLVFHSRIDEMDWLGWFGLISFSFISGNETWIQLIQWNQSSQFHFLQSIRKLSNQANYFNFSLQFKLIFAASLRQNLIDFRIQLSFILLLLVYHYYAFINQLLQYYKITDNRYIPALITVLL